MPSVPERNKGIVLKITRPNSTLLFTHILPLEDAHCSPYGTMESDPGAMESDPGAMVAPPRTV
jgi:hypothetical protein